MIDTLIIGGDSLIGSDLYRHLKAAGEKVVVTSRRDGAIRPDSIHFDLSRPTRMDLIAKTVVMCAGITDLKFCEADPAATRRVNVDSTVAVLENAHAEGSRVIYLSSHAVFDGLTPMLPIGAPTSAIIEYGKQKSEVEKRLIALGERACVVRMTKVMSCQVALISKWISSLEKNESISPFEDLSMSPISLRFLVSLIADYPIRGMVHVSSGIQLTYAEFANELVRMFGFRRQLVCPVSAKDAGIELLYRPRFTTLAMADTEKRFGVGSQSLRAVMADLLQEYSSSKLG